MDLNKKISIHAYKFNGFIYRSWEFPTVIEETKEYVCVSSKDTHVITGNPDTKKFYHSQITRPTIWYFFKDKWYNIIIAYKNNRYYFYINIASPFVFEDETIKYIDLDIDYEIGSIESPRLKTLDENEFKENRVKYNYSAKLIKQIEIARNEILEMFKNGTLKKYLNKELLFKGAR